MLFNHIVSYWLGWNSIYKMITLLVYHYKAIKRDLDPNRIKLRKIKSELIEY